MAADENVPQYLRTHRLRGEVLRFTIETEERALRALAVSSAAGRAARTLVKEGPLRITLVTLGKGAALEEHPSVPASGLPNFRGFPRRGFHYPYGPSLAHLAVSL